MGIVARKMGTVMELMVLWANSTGSGAAKMPYSQESFGSGSFELEVEVLCWRGGNDNEEALDIQKNHK